MTDAPVRTDDAAAQRRVLLWWSALVLSGLSLVWMALRAGADPGTAAPPFVGSYTVDVPAATVLPALVAGAALTAAWRGWQDRAPWPAVLAAGALCATAWTLSLAVARDPADVRLPAALAWAVTVPLVATAVRGVCGDLPARRYVPVLALAPYALWVGDTAQAVVAALAAAAVAAGAHASDHRRRGGPAAAAAVAAGLLLGTGTALTPGAAWLGLAIACLYFARRRAALNLLTAGAALLATYAVRRLGLDGPPPTDGGPTLLWWGLDAVVLLLAAGPPLAASLWRLRNTPGWPFLVGAGAAVLFTAGRGVEHVWLPYLPWLTVAAVAPHRQAGPPTPAPVWLVAGGALTALTLCAILRVRW